MPMKFNLDFKIESSQDRLNFVKQINLSTLTKKELELCTDYILYGKDPDGTSSVDRKEIYIKTKYGSYSRQEPISLDEMMESPTFDETVLQPNNIYKKVKPTIDKEKCKDIPGMKELWEQIEKIDRKIKLVEGKIEPDCGETIPQLSSKDLYQLKHMLIELRKDQYILKDTAFPEIQGQKNYGSFWENPTNFQLNYPVFPCGVMEKENDQNFIKPWLSEKRFAAIDLENQIEKLKKAEKPFFNFLDKEHIYQLCLNYYEIKDFAEHFPNSPLNGLLWTLDFYIEKANLSEQQNLIVECKKRRLLNRDICKVLQEKLGICHQENYVSTIWNRVCGLIADAAELNYDEWCCKDYKPAWKVCSCCGETLLRDPRNFVRKSKAVDGLTSRCKKCDSKKRRGEI